MSKMPRIPKEQSSFGGSANLDGAGVERRDAATGL